MDESAGLRVLMLLENCPYPQDVRVRHEAEALAAAGHRVTVIGPAAQGQPRREVVNGVRVYRFPAASARGGLVGYLREYGWSLVLIGVLSVVVAVREGFDVVHAHNPPDLLALIAGFWRLLGRRFVYDQHDLCPEMYDARYGAGARPSVRRMLGISERLAYRLADRVIVTNESYRAVALARGRVPPERITIVRNGPDPDRWRPVPPDPGERRDGKTLIGYAGVLGAQDGGDALLRALVHLVFDLGRTDFRCVIIGDGDALPGLRALADQRGLAPYVEFAGWLSGDALLRRLAALDIGVEPAPCNPYTDRSTMIKVMEYMALAKPVVAFDLTEHRVSAGDAAAYARPGDELDFARQIAALMDDPPRRQRMGAVGRARVEASLAWPHQREHLLALYAELARGSTSPPTRGEGA